MENEEIGDLMETIFDKLANNYQYEMFDVNTVENMRLTHNLENEYIIEIEKGGKTFVMTIMERTNE